MLRSEIHPHVHAVILAVITQSGYDARASAASSGHSKIVAYLNGLAKKRKASMEAAEKDDKRVAATDVACVRSNAAHPVSLTTEQKKGRHAQGARNL